MDIQMSVNIKYRVLNSIQYMTELLKPDLSCNWLEHTQNCLMEAEEARHKPNVLQYTECCG